MHHAQDRKAHPAGPEPQRPDSHWLKPPSQRIIPARQAPSQPGREYPSICGPNPVTDLKIIGLLQPPTPPEDHSLELQAFAHIRRHIPPENSGGRLIGLQNSHLRFLGIEVRGDIETPQGMVQWELADETLTVGRPEATEPRQVHIGWKWRTPLQSDPQRWLGEPEILAPCHQETLLAKASLELFAHVPFQPDKQFQDDVEIVEYDPDWTNQAREMIDWLRQTLPAQALGRIEHYGSTSIKDMIAKPLIDLLVEVPSFPHARLQVLSALNDPTWEYWWYIDHMILIKRRTPMGLRTHHLHIAPAGHRIWQGLTFRNYLADHPDIANRYAQLKRDLAANFSHDRERYTRQKGDFVQHWTDRAIQDQT